MVQSIAMHKFTSTIWYSLVAAALLIAIVTVTTGLLVLIPVIILLLVLAYVTANAVTWTRQRAAEVAERGIPFWQHEAPAAQQVLLPGGEELAGRSVPLPDNDGFRMVLTARGYMFTNDEGQVRYMLRPDVDR